MPNSEITTAGRDRLRQYARDCESLYSDLELIIEDLEFRISEGRTIRYAVDFSEIYSYISPEDIPQVMRLLLDDEDEVVRAAEQRELHNLFFQHPNKPILLDPYLMEFMSWMDYFHRQEFYNFATD